MTKEKQIEQLIEKTRPEFQNKEIVAFLGKVSSGKTVVSALLKYTLSKSWIPKSKGKWEAVASSGYDEINEILRNLKKGIFTSPTPETNYPRLVLDIHNMEGKPTKIELALHDMSGENYADLLTDTSYANIEERLIDILSGDGAYLAYAKKYIILIDCNEKDDWDTDVAQVAPMISTIREIKRKIHNFDQDEQIHNPIAIIFTKSDLLQVDDEKKSAEELAKDYPELLSSLRINHDQKHLGFFKVSISASRESQEDAETRVKKKEEELMEKFEKQMKTLKKQIETAIEQAVETAKVQAKQNGQPEEQINSIAEETRRQTYEKYKDQLEQKPPSLDKRDEELKTRWKVNIPLTYTESEYNRIISWIIEQKMIDNV